MEAEVLIVDGYGYLVSVYRYGNLAYVGGGFTSGIHSILEPAAFGLPVIIGPDYHKFQEAYDMIDLGAAICISNYEELEFQMDTFLSNPKILKDASASAVHYVDQNRGASKEIVKYLFS